MNSVCTAVLGRPGLGDCVVIAVLFSFQPAPEDQTPRVITGVSARICTLPRDSASAIPASMGQPASSAGLGDSGLTVSVCGHSPVLACLLLYVSCPDPSHPLDPRVVTLAFFCPPALSAFSLLGCHPSIHSLKEPHFYS